ncbi:MAG: FAD-dependent oxidoreductase, partial [Candidatus Methanomethylicia archaeon]
ENFYKYGIYQVLVKYFPQFINVYPSNSHAGYYDISIDGLPIVHKESNITVVGGTSGNGLSKADALGRITAATCLNREYAELYGGEKFKVSDLSIVNRNIDKEIFII